MGYKIKANYIPRPHPEGVAFLITGIYRTGLVGVVGGGGVTGERKGCEGEEGRMLWGWLGGGGLTEKE